MAKEVCGVVVWCRVFVFLVVQGYDSLKVSLFCRFTGLIFFFRSRVVPSKEGLAVLESVLLCLYRIKSFVCV